jgi:peptide/nickel transport system permease protein
MGASAFGALLREAVPNALTAALPAFANAMAVFLTGTFFVEVIFGISGLGRLTYEAISNKDITLLAALCLLFATAISMVSTLLEIVRFAIDPRLRSPHG